MRSWTKSPWKRLFDLTLVVLTIPLWAALILLVMLPVAISLGRPIFFRQQRPGRHGKAFTLIKFRTMTAEKDAAGKLLPDEQRASRLGALLRASSLDELPELFNVLKGDMSLVGPRPLLMEYLPLYSTGQARRHEIRPGLTGLAQTSGRNNLPWPQVLHLDVWYVDNGSFGLDLRIMAKTLLKVLKRSDINAADVVGRKKFNGES